MQTDEQGVATLAAQCRMQAHENLDPEYSAFMVSVADQIEALQQERGRMREALEKAASRFEHCADLIATSFNISGNLRAERTIKAKHFALETRDAIRAINGEDDG